MSAADRLRAVRGIRHKYRTDRRTFEGIVAEVVRSLPEPFRDRLSNVGIGVEEWPDEDTVNEGVDDDEETELLGLYQGVPYGDRQTDYNLVLPDRITIYRGPILAASRNAAEAREEIRLTVLHEIGHYFGLGDDELP
jgi:predicted Zn-dependent protease with MMP-like domain